MSVFGVLWWGIFAFFDYLSFEESVGTSLQQQAYEDDIIKKHWGLSAGSLSDSVVHSQNNKCMIPFLQLIFW